MRISVLGLGNWGTALGNHLANKGYDVLGWCLEEEVAQSINNKNINPQYLTSVVLNPKLKATNNIEDLFDCDYLLNVIPANYLEGVFKKVKVNDKAIFVNATKGLDPKTLATPIDLAKKFIPNLTHYCVISGPSFAKDIVIKKPAGIVCACDTLSIATQVAKDFSSESLRIYSSDDVMGVELGGILKNVIAIGVGVVDGLGLGDSARAGLITRGLAEIMRLSFSMGAKKETLFGLSGLGDLVLTATCDTSRNRQIGLYLGQGKSLEEAIVLAGSTAEGVFSAPILKKLAEKYNVEMPISKNILDLLNGEITPMEMYQNLINRPIKSEFD